MDKQKPGTIRIGDKVNEYYKQELSYLNELGGKEVVVVDIVGSQWKGKLTKYSFMYVELDDDFKIPLANIKKIIEVEQ